MIFKSITVSEIAHKQAKQLVSLGIEESIGKAFGNAIKEYFESRKGLVAELCAVREKYVKTEAK